MVDYLELGAALASSPCLHLVDVLRDGCDTPDVLPRYGTETGFAVILQPVLVLIVERVSEIGHPELRGKPVCIGPVGSHDYLSTLLGYEVVDCIGLGLVDWLLWGDNQEHGPVRVLPVVDEHGSGHRVCHEVPVSTVIKAAAHVRELVELLLLVRRVGRRFAHDEQHRKQQQQYHGN